MGQSPVPSVSPEPPESAEPPEESAVSVARGEEVLLALGEVKVFQVILADLMALEKFDAPRIFGIDLLGGHAEDHIGFEQSVGIVENNPRTIILNEPLRKGDQEQVAVILQGHQDPVGYFKVFIDHYPQLTRGLLQVIFHFATQNIVGK